jgi:hypothetical protein
MLRSSLERAAYPNVLLVAQDEQHTLIPDANGVILVGAQHSGRDTAKQIRELCGLTQRDVTHTVSELEGASDRHLQMNHCALASTVKMGSSLLKESWTAHMISRSGATLAEPLAINCTATASAGAGNYLVGGGSQAARDSSVASSSCGRGARNGRLLRRLFG